MLTRHDNFNFHFSFGGYDFHISNIVLERFERFIPSHSHSKNSYEIHYIPFGNGTAIINGTTYEITPNTLFITGPFIEHSQIPIAKDPMTEYCIYLKLGHSSVAVESKSDRKLAQLFKNTDFWFGQDTQDIHSLMKQLFFELEHQYTGYSIQAEILLKQLIIKLIRNYENKHELSPQIPIANLYDNKYLIIEECFLYEYSTLTLEQLASRLGLGIRQTERLLKDHYGKTFLQKKTEARMSAASTLLQNSNLSITQIAEAVGYSCVEHFSASFKRFYNESATTYRKKFLIK